MTRNHNHEPKSRLLSKSESGRLGALSRYAKYGNPGTKEGRKKGGLLSQATHRILKSNFKQRIEIRYPKDSNDLAEFLGVMLGDGHLGKYQASITTNSETDSEHAQYVSVLIYRLFGLTATIRPKKSSKAVVVVVSSVNVCDFLSKVGLCLGNKVKNGVSIPKWILNNKEFSRYCIRGLFDTDGCVYVDMHRIKGKVYRNVGIAFTNRNTNLLSFFKQTLEAYNLHPTQKTKYTVFLRRKKEIEMYFTTIGTSNPKHSSRYLSYRDFGRVA